MKKSHLLGAVCVSIFGIVSNITYAAPIIINITAEIAFVDDIGGILGGVLNVGDTLSGSYKYESTTTDTNILPTVGDYWHSSSPYGITLHGGGFTFETDPGNVNFLVEIVNNHGVPGSDNYLLRSYNNLSLSNGVFVNHISWQLDDPTLSALSSDELPVTPPNLTDWQSNFGISMDGCSAVDPSGFCDFSNFSFFIRANVTSVSLVPGPPSLTDTYFGMNVQNNTAGPIEVQLLDITYIGGSGIPTTVSMPSFSAFTCAFTGTSCIGMPDIGGLPSTSLSTYTNGGDGETTRTIGQTVGIDWDVSGPVPTINIVGVTVIAVGATWTASGNYTLGLIPSGSGDTELVSSLAAPQGDIYDSLAGGAGNPAVPFIATTVSDPLFDPLLGQAFGDFIFAAAVPSPPLPTLEGRLPATPSGTDYQAYYDPNLNISWLANANAGAGSIFDDGFSTTDGAMSWNSANNWAASLTIGGVSGWRLPNENVNGDSTIVDCSSSTEEDCRDNEYGHLYWYGAGTTLGNGITSSNFNPFTNVQSFLYWSGTDLPPPNNSNAWAFPFNTGIRGFTNKANNLNAWAVYDGDVGATLKGSIADTNISGVFTYDTATSVPGVGLLGGWTQYDITDFQLIFHNGTVSAVWHLADILPSPSFSGPFAVVQDSLGTWGLSHAAIDFCQTCIGTETFVNVNGDVLRISLTPQDVNGTRVITTTSYQSIVLSDRTADQSGSYFVSIPASPDSDSDAIADSTDNCPVIVNSSQSNIDGDSNGDLCDACPADNTNTCNPNGSAASEITATIGGTIATPDGQLSIEVDPFDLHVDSTISATQITSLDPDVNLIINAFPGAGSAIVFYDLGPDGLQFDNVVTLTVAADVTGLSLSMRNMIDLYRFADTNADGTPDTFVSLGATCSINENPIGTFIATCTVQIDHFSTYAIIVPSDLDDDGVPDNFDGVGDNCTLLANADQRDTDLDGYGNRCDADIAIPNNGVVNLSDYSAFRAAFGGTGTLTPAQENADFNGDGFVNLSDYSIFRSSFGKAPGPSCCAP